MSTGKSENVGGTIHEQVNGKANRGLLRVYVRTLLCVGAVGVVLLALNGCGSQNLGRGRNPTAAERRSTLVWALRGHVDLSDPAMVADTESGMVVSQVCEGLLRFENNTSRVVPALATALPEVSADGTRWTFRLRSGVTFHDGTRLDAQAVRFSFMRQMDPSHPFHVSGRMSAARRIFGDPTTRDSVIVRDIETPDDSTVVFVLARPCASFARNLAMPQAAIVSPRAVMNAAADGQTTMVGTGPFRVESVRAGRSIRLGRNPNYWGAMPALETIVLRMIGEPVERERALREKQCDVVAGLPPHALKKLAREKQVRVVTAPAMNGCVLVLNQAVPPLDLPKVRRAICAAVDREALAKDVLAGYADAAQGWLPLGMEEAAGTPDGARVPQMDRAAAKQMLMEAGFAGGFALKLLTVNMPRIYNPAPLSVAERVASDLSAVGISVMVEQGELETVARRLETGDYQMAIWGAAAWNGDPSAYWRDLVGDGEHNRMGYRSPRVLSLLEQLERNFEHEARIHTCREMEMVLRDEMPFVPLFYARQTVAVRHTVTGLTLNALGLTRLADVRLDDGS